MVRPDRDPVEGVRYRVDRLLSSTLRAMLPSSELAVASLVVARMYETAWGLNISGGQDGREEHEHDVGGVQIGRQLAGLLAPPEVFDHRDEESAVLGA